MYTYNQEEGNAPITKEDKEMMKWSDSLEEMVVAQFTWKGHLFVWNDIDCVYYDETEGDESYLMEVPEGAEIK